MFRVDVGGRLRKCEREDFHCSRAMPSTFGAVVLALRTGQGIAALLEHEAAVGAGEEEVAAVVAAAVTGNAAEGWFRFIRVVVMAVWVVDRQDHIDQAAA